MNMYTELLSLVTRIATYAYEEKRHYKLRGKIKTFPTKFFFSIESEWKLDNLIIF